MSTCTSSDNLPLCGIVLNKASLPKGEGLATEIFQGGGQLLPTCIAIYRLCILILTVCPCASQQTERLTHSCESIASLQPCLMTVIVAYCTKLAYKFSFLETL